MSKRGQAGAGFVMLVLVMGMFGIKSFSDQTVYQSAYNDLQQKYRTLEDKTIDYDYVVAENKQMKINQQWERKRIYYAYNIIGDVWYLLKNNSTKYSPEIIANLDNDANEGKLQIIWDGGYWGIKPNT